MTNGRDYEIEVRVQKPWITTPLSIFEDKDLSIAARFVLAYLLGQGSRPNWKIRVRYVQARLDISRARWASACRELKARGYYVSFRYQNEITGKLDWQHIVTDVPGNLRSNAGGDEGQAEGGAGGPGIGGSKKSMARFSSTGSSSAGRSRVGKASPIRNKTLRTKNLKEAEAPPDAPAAPHRRKYGEQVCISGVTIWTESDLVTTNALLADYGEQAVVDAARAISEQGEKPYPSMVGAYLSAKRKAGLAQAGKNQGAERLKGLDEASRKRGDREMAELLSQWGLPAAT